MEQSNRFAQEYLQPKITELFRHEKFDRDIYRQMGENGFLGCMANFNDNETISYTGYGLVNREIERVDSAMRSLLSVQNSLVIFPINEYGTEKAKKRLLPKLMSGEFIGSFGLTEPDHGSDPGGMKTRVVKKVRNLDF